MTPPNSNSSCQFFTVLNTQYLYSPLLAPFLWPSIIAFWFCVPPLIFRGQLLYPLHLWIKDIVIKLAFALLHVCPGSPSPLRSQGHISEFLISMLAKMGKRKLPNLESCEIFSAFNLYFSCKWLFIIPSWKLWSVWRVVCSLWHLSWV